MISIIYAKLYCTDYKKVENYEQAVNDENKWHIHHRLETHFSDGTERPKNAQITKAELKALDMYNHRPPEELIFLPIEQHISLHRNGSELTREQKKRISETLKGKMKGSGNGMYGKKHSEEARKKMSEKRKGQGWIDGQKERYSETVKGRCWWTNGKVDVLSKKQPDGFWKGRSKVKGHKSTIGYKWKIVDGKHVYYKEPL